MLIGIYFASSFCMTKISIIIPVYNHLDLTIQCIQSIKKHCKEIPYEIIISDDCSTDETKDFFSGRDDIVYIRNDSNRGFAYTCNRGAEIAKGEYLLFLNNDTLLIDNILTKILKTFEKYSNVGAIGAKLLHEDGTIQHAGVLIYPNKTFIHLFRLFPSDYHGANKFRDLDAVTGACFFIERNFFKEVGMFDESFINGFEDVDLCYKIKENGKKIIYNPEIQIFHFEEKSRGRNLKREEYNSKILWKKWWEKITPSSFLLEEGYDFKINEFGVFYIIKKGNFESEKTFNEQELLKIIRKEPLDFTAFKKLIYIYIEQKEIDKAIEVCRELIKFEPTKDNIETLGNLCKLKGDINTYNKLNDLIVNYEIRAEFFKKKFSYMLKYYQKRNEERWAKYFKEWLEGYGK